MKYLMLLRHAKSSWDQPDLDDYDRPLSGRGLTDAPRMGSFIKNTGYKPGIILSSSARRARQTTEAVAQAMKLDHQRIIWSDNLYLSGAREYLKGVNRFPDEVEKAIIVGHNPNIEETASILISGEIQNSFRVPTAGLICFESYAQSWKEVGPGTCKLKWMMIPKVLRHLMN